MRKLTLLLIAFSSILVEGYAQLSWGTQIGLTYYDLHSNASVANRFVKNADGTMSATWIEHWDYLTTANEPKPAVRGFGYNHFDPSGGGWVYGTEGECWEDPFGCASSYTGWSELINNPNGQGDDEIVISHAPLKITSRASIGTGSWSNTSALGVEADMGQGTWSGTWPRAVSSGNYIHMIASSADPNNTGLFDGTGVEMPVVYFRSSNGGLSWDITNQAFNIDTSDLKDMGADAYAIHANGSNVAVTFGGGNGNDWLMFKSTNNGQTWAKTVVKDNHNLTPVFIGLDGDGYVTNNETFEIIIDDNGKVHCFAAMSMLDNQYIYTDPDLYKSSDAGILYWSEGMAQPILVATPDYGADGNAADYSIPGSARYGANFICAWPSASFDASGNLYLIYSAVAENTLHINATTLDSTGYMDLYMVFSLDNGSTWCRTSNPINIADDIAGNIGGTPTQDDLFPGTIPKLINGELDFIWQGDWSEPGLALSDDTHPNDNLNYIHHYRIDVSNLTSCASVPTQGSTGPVLSVNSTTGTSCFGANDGIAVVSATGGAGNYTYSSDGVNFSSSTTLTGLSGGTITLYVQDGAGAISTATATISQPSQIVIGSSSTTNASCGASDGAFTVTGAGGNGGYTYSIDGVNYQSNGTFTSLAANTYTVYIKDVSNCVGTGTVTVSNVNGPSASIINTNNVSCDGDTDGSVTLQATGGSGGYTYSLNGVNFQSSNVLSNLAVGTYVATVKDNNGCIVTISFTISEPSAVIFNSVVANGATCGANDGSIQASASGGTGTIQYSIDGTSFQTSGTFTNLAVGNYAVRAKDANGCEVVFNTNITNPGAPSVNVSGNQTVCEGESTVITVSPSGGQSPYQFSVNGSTYLSNNTFTLTAGNYSFYVRDNVGCVGIQNGFTIGETVCNGIEDMTTLVVKLYPNPSTGIYNLELKDQIVENVNVRIMDFLGRELHNMQVHRNAGVQQIDLSEESDGIYFLQLTTENGVKRTLKLIKD